MAVVWSKSGATMTMNEKATLNSISHANKRVGLYLSASSVGTLVERGLISQLKPARGGGGYYVLTPSGAAELKLWRETIGHSRD